MHLSDLLSLIKEYDRHHFTQFVKNKKVIIVGPDTSLKGRALGKYIDSYDIVIRHNTVFEYLPFKSSYSKDYGSRTDILYLSPSCIKNYAFKTQNILKMRNNKIKYVVYQNGNRHHKYLTGEYCFPKALAYFKNRLPKIKVKTHYSHHSTLALTKLLSKSKPVVPRTGFISIVDMIVHQAKKVMIVGMSFYHGGGHAFRRDAKKQLDPLKDHQGKDSPHDSHLELVLVREIMEKYPQVKFKYPLNADNN